MREITVDGETGEPVAWSWPQISI